MTDKEDIIKLMKEMVDAYKTSEDFMDEEEAKDHIFVKDVESFKEAGMKTKEKGVVLTLDNGQRFTLMIEE